VNVNKCHEIVNKPIILALCPVRSEICNVRLEGHTHGEAHGHNHDHRSLEVHPMVKRSRCGGTLEAPPSTPSRFDGKGTVSAMIDLGNYAERTDQDAGA
jgi:hypothetical protein